MTEAMPAALSMPACMSGTCASVIAAPARHGRPSDRASSTVAVMAAQYSGIPKRGSPDTIDARDDKPPYTTGQPGCTS